MKISFVRGGLPDLLVRLWQHLGARRQRQFLLLIGLMVITAFAESISLGAVLQFLAVLITPDQVFHHPVVANAAKALGITTADELVLPLTAVFITTAILAGLIRILYLWASTRFAYACGATLSNEVYRRTLYQPYSVHVNRNSSEVISGIVGKVGGTVGVLLYLQILVSSFLLLATITLALMAIDPVVASAATLGFGTCYACITWFSRKQLYRNSQRIAYEHPQVQKALQEGLGGIRDVLLDGTQPAYCDIYRRADYPLRRAQGNITFISQSPRYAMEALGMVVIAALAYGLSRQSGGVAAAIPALGAMALGAQRLLPALQQIFGAWAGIAGTHASLADAIDLLDQPLPADILLPTPPPLAFARTIRFEAVRFRYANDGPWVLDGFNLTIPKGARIGFVGSTGSGKSTTLDLLMGLLTPTAGEILVDDLSINGGRVRAWQRTIAHVPQSIYLADTTLAENIAFGVPADVINMDKVRQAARQAQIAAFIESRPEGYEAHVGERGVRLSGGQRQRIGIARALYKQAGVLVFDEATSALDNATEQSVMDAIEGLDRELTILLIAHRLTTVRRCDIIVELEHGQVVAQGTYEELLACSPSFRNAAKTAA